MSIVISRDIVLTDESIEDPYAGHIGYRSLITRSNISADSEEVYFEVVNVANVATNLFWRSTSLDEQYITINAGLNAGIDYVGFANHNFGTGGIAYQVEGSDDGVDWTLISDELIPDSDAPHVQKFPLAVHTMYRIRLLPDVTLPRAAVIYLGKMLVLQRRIYVGHTPITMGRDTTFTTNRSESGHFLGRTIRRESRQSAVDLRNITPEWYRSYFDDFAEASRTRPFFWAWRPAQYPLEVGYVWTTDDIVPKNQRSNGMMQVGFKVQGIAAFSANGVDADIST
jgi:hypothetical protein